MSFLPKNPKIPMPSDCENQWCDNRKGNFPTTGMLNSEGAQCSSYKTVNQNRLEDGGISGRGVTPCPFGNLNTLQFSDIPMNKIPLKDITSSIFFQPSKKVASSVPPYGNPRPLTRIGNEWRNS